MALIGKRSFCSARATQSGIEIKFAAHAFMFWKRKSPPQEVTSGRFELERDGKIAYLEYTIAGDVLALLHTEVPRELRGHGIAGSLAKTALDWARANAKKVDVICPSVTEYIEKNPEYQDLVLR